MWNKKFIVVIIALAPMIVADPPFVGRWIEDETLRTGLYDYLWARGKFSTERQHPMAIPFHGLIIYLFPYRIINQSIIVT